VLGLCSLIMGPVPGLIGLILGIVALAQKTLRRGMAITGIVTGTVSLLLMPALLVPAFRHGRNSARISVCAANLNSIGKGYFIYAAKYDTPPPDIDTLIRQGTAAKAFQCPSARTGRRSDYFYLPAGGDADPLTIIACDFKGNHPDGTRSVLTHTGMVRTLSEAAFQVELTQPYNAAFAEALRKVEGP
jgi:hypothetical protein